MSREETKVETKIEDELFSKSAKKDVHQLEVDRKRAANPVATKVTLLLLAEGVQRTVEHLVRERSARVDRMRELTAAKHMPGTTLQEVLAADHALAHLDADLRWIESARRRIHDLEGEIA